MAQHVLEGLLYDLCEVYIDDVLMDGSNEEEYVSNLRAVIQRLRDRKVTINPDKCIFGVAEIEFVAISSIRTVLPSRRPNSTV